jgi:DNA-binding beta-propeller fold protein YncE
MANTTGITEAAGAAGGVAVAERVAAAHALWVSTLPTIRRAPVGGLLPQLLRTADLEPRTEPIAAPALAVVGAIAAGHGPISDMAVSADGSRLVAAHFGADVVSVVDSATMSVAAAITDIPEPCRVTVADRAYVSSASDSDDAIVAIDPTTGKALAAKTVDMTAGGLAVSPGGDVLYVGRNGDEAVDIAAIDVETGATEVIEITTVPGASLDAVRLSADGTRLFAALTTASGGSLAIVDTRSGVLQNTASVDGSIGDIAVAPNGRKAFVTGWDNELGGVIHVIDVAAARVVDTIAVGGLPTQLVVGRGGDAVFIVDRDQILVLCTATNEIVDSVVIGGQLSCLAASPDGARLYAADYAGGITVLQVEAGASASLDELMTTKLRQLAAAAS